jgi:hypothetical protein
MSGPSLCKTRSAKELGSSFVRLLPYGWLWPSHVLCYENEMLQSTAPACHCVASYESPLCVPQLPVFGVHS